MEKTIKQASMSITELVIRLIIDTFATIILIGFYWFIRDLIRFFTTSLVLTNKRIYGTTIGKNLSAPLEKVDSVQIERNPFEMLWGSGKIIIVTNSSEFYFRGISNPYEFRELVLDQKEKKEDERMDKQADKIKNSVNEIKKDSSNFDDIKEYKKLLDEGIITSEEFENKKKELLKL